MLEAAPWLLAAGAVAAPFIAAGIAKEDYEAKLKAVIDATNWPEPKARTYLLGYYQRNAPLSDAERDLAGRAVAALAEEKPGLLQAPNWLPKNRAAALLIDKRVDAALKGEWQPAAAGDGPVKPLTFPIPPPPTKTREEYEVVFAAAQQPGATDTSIRAALENYRSRVNAGALASTPDGTLAPALAAGKDKKIEFADLGSRLWTGGGWTYYEYGENEMVAVMESALRVRNPGGIIRQELAESDRSRALGLRTVDMRLVDVGTETGGERPGILINGRYKVLSQETSGYLNRQSMVDLWDIQDAMKEKNIGIRTVRYFVSQDGRVVLAHPRGVYAGGLRARWHRWGNNDELYSLMNIAKPYVTRSGKERMPLAGFETIDGLPAGGYPPSIGAPRTVRSLAELRASGALPGSRGIVLLGKDGTITPEVEVNSGEFWLIAEEWGREFALAELDLLGKTGLLIYSGDAGRVSVRPDARTILHTHPSSDPSGRVPSEEDIAGLNEQYRRARRKNPNLEPWESRVAWGPGREDNTVFKARKTRWLWPVGR
jgi:hypothetical protein